MPPSRPISRLLLRALRQTAVGMAVLAVLMTAFRVHLHGGGGDAHGHAGGLSLVAAAEGGDAASGIPRPPGDEGCGSCHCPPAHDLNGADPVIAQISAATSRPVQAHAGAAPDAPCYPPDPPPVRPL